jgi:predicted XRE-type DNA-binding protein
MARKSELIGDDVTYSETDVFHELGLANADELLAKAKLAIAIHKTIEARGLNQAQAAQVIGVDQPKVSKIIRGKLTDFSTERLLSFLIRLGSDIDIVVHKPGTPPKKEGMISVAYM